MAYKKSKMEKSEYSSMNHGRGSEPGDMNPKVDDYQASSSEYAGMQNKTLDYIPRRDRLQTKEAKDIDKQAYKGRYD